MKDKSDLAKGWFAKAESDLASARHILAGPGSYDTVCFHSQQAVEKYSGSRMDHIQNPTCLKKPLASVGERVCRA
jgi:uroporphyrinogen-III synthase